MTAAEPTSAVHGVTVDRKPMHPAWSGTPAGGRTVNTARWQRRLARHGAGASDEPRVNTPGGVVVPGGQATGPPGGRPGAGLPGPAPGSERRSGRTKARPAHQWRLPVAGGPL